MSFLHMLIDGEKIPLHFLVTDETVQDCRFGLQLLIQIDVVVTWHFVCALDMKANLVTEEEHGHAYLALILTAIKPETDREEHSQFSINLTQNKTRSGSYQFTILVTLINGSGSTFSIFGEIGMIIGSFGSFLRGGSGTDSVWHRASTSLEFLTSLVNQRKKEIDVRKKAIDIITTCLLTFCLVLWCTRATLLL